MKDCPELDELLLYVVGDNCYDYFEQIAVNNEQDVRVFTLVQNKVRSKNLVN